MLQVTGSLLNKSILVCIQLVQVQNEHHGSLLRSVSLNANVTLTQFQISTILFRLAVCYPEANLELYSLPHHNSVLKAFAVNSGGFCLWVCPGLQTQIARISSAAPSSLEPSPDVGPHKGVGAASLLALLSA